MESGPDKDLDKEAQLLNKKIMDMRYADFWDNEILKPVVEFLFGNSIPVAQFPNVEKCLGLQPKNSQMTIHEGYAIQSFDYSVK